MGPARKTYWHLQAARRIPTDYEVATSRLLYYVDRGGFSLELPASAFYARHQRGSALVSDRWEDFSDPRATTYTKYVGLQRERESYLTRLLAATEDGAYDAALGPEWLDLLARVLSPLRYLCHGLQMVSAYVGQMAPSGRITVASLFQASDEDRRVERLAYRVAQIRRLRAEVAEEGRRRWESDPAWQPWRRALEHLLVTYDWGESLVALNLCLKPLVDELFTVELAALSEQRGDYLDAQILRALFEDCQWHREWSRALLAGALRDRPQNRPVVSGWVEAWAPMMTEALATAGEVLGIDETAVARARARLSVVGAVPGSGAHG
jgi:hypothetical protein